MKLKNRKTGEIVDVESLGHADSLKGKFWYQVTLSWKIDEHLDTCKTYNSLAELNEEWEDYEEPKRHWIIDTMNDRVEDFDVSMTFNESIGNYFETKEEAEKAVEKLKAWKRLKDKGFRFERWCVGGEYGNTITFSDYIVYNDETRTDLDLLFGGEE